LEELSVFQGKNIIFLSSIHLFTLTRGMMPSPVDNKKIGIFRAEEGGLSGLCASEEASFQAHEQSL
jgi:hypothetical protein